MDDVLKKTMVKYLNVLGIFVVVFALPAIAINETFAEDLIFDAPTRVVATPDNSLEIVGIRKSSNSFEIVEKLDSNGARENLVYVNEKALVGAWLKAGTFADAVAMAKIDQPSVSKIAASGIDAEKFDWSSFNQKNTGVEATFAYTDGTAVDARAITAMTAAGYFDLKNQRTIDQQSGLWVPIKEEYSDMVQGYLAATKILNDGKASPLSELKIGPTTFAKLASTKLGILDDVKVEIGKASFGKSLVMSSKEAGFKLDENLRRKFDIYLVEFVATLYDVDVSKLAEISFRVKCGDLCTAWEMAPIRVDTEKDVETTAKTPTVGFKGFEVGEMYSRTIRFKELNPIIVAYGLRESEFSWSLKGDAMSQGSHQFLAAIGVPKGTKKFQFEKSFAVRTSGYVFEGDWADTGILSESIDLKK